MQLGNNCLTKCPAIPWPRREHRTQAPSVRCCLSPSNCNLDYPEEERKQWIYCNGVTLKRPFLNYLDPWSLSGFCLRQNLAVPLCLHLCVCVVTFLFLSLPQKKYFPQLFVNPKTFLTSFPFTMRK